MKRCITILTSVALCMGMTACKPENMAFCSLETPAPVTLNVVTCYGGDDGNHSHYQDAVDDFMEKYNVNVAEMSAVSNEDWKNSVLADFITGSEPDVLFYFVGADADPFVNADKVVSIEEIRQEYPDYASNMKDSMMPVAQNGKHYAVPSTGFWENMFVNKRVLEECGIPVPGSDYTWEQFLTDCAKIKDKGYTPIACSLFEIPHYWFEFMVMNHGTPGNHLDLPGLDEKGDLVDDPVSRKWIQALEDIRMLYEAGYFPEDTLTASDAQTVSLFTDGEAAFLVEGSWKVGFFTENYGDRLSDFVVSFVPGRGERKATDAIGGISMGYFISRKAWDNPQKRQAAVDFVKHMTADDVLSAFVTTEMTALESGAHSRDLNEIQESAADANSCITSFSGAVQDTMSSDAKSELFSNIPKVVTGKMTAAKAVELAMKLN